jgi:hypothetical protein
VQRLNHGVDFRLSDAGSIVVILLQKEHLNVTVTGVQVNHDCIPAGVRITLLKACVRVGVQFKYS